ncbi:MAG: hypothetical protein HYW45_04325 [Candidatus Daviesbacteria bacterium]|nr:MAG: hypothetical protein HYW45_04325 [Candidatus Daviesbacteria bacterium]
MPIFTLRTGATAHPEGSVLQDITDTIDTSGVNSANGTDFKVAAQTTPDLTVKVQLGRAYIEASSGNTYPIRADSDSNVSIASNSSGNPRIDALVLFIDLSAAPNTDASNVAKLQVVQGTPAPSPVAPTDSAIQTDIGASNPFIRLANITVASGATSITNPNIADTRFEVVYVFGGIRTTKGYLFLKEQSAAPGTPPSGQVVVYAKSDNKVYKKDDTGVESEVGSGGGGATDIITGEVPAGAIDGVNTSFTTSVNFATGTLRVHKNGIRLKGGGVDFTEGVGGFTLVTPPAAGTILLVDYFKVSTIAAGGSTSFIYNEVSSGVINGVNVNFATAFPYIGGTLQVYRDGQLMKPGAGNDYVETDPSSGLFDFVIAPATNSNLQVSYQKSLSVTGNADTVDGFHASSTPTANQLLALDNNAKVPSSALPTAAVNRAFPWYVSGSLATGVNFGPRYVVPQNLTIIKCWLIVRTAPTGADIIIDINKNGSTIWSTQANRGKIVAGSTNGNTTTFNITSLAPGDFLDLDIDQVGSSVAGVDLTVVLECSQP